MVNERVVLQQNLKTIYDLMKQEHTATKYTMEVYEQDVVRLYKELENSRVKSYYASEKITLLEKRMKELEQIIDTEKTQVEDVQK
jgi:hypothetical protein